MSASIRKLNIWKTEMGAITQSMRQLSAKDAELNHRRSGLAFACTLWLLVMLVCSRVTPAQAQQQPTAAHGLEFETVSIRPSHSYPGCYSSLPPNSTHFEATCEDLRSLITWAFKTKYVEGGGSALDTLYDIRATTPDDAPWTNENIRPMLRHMLEQRFGLQVHAGTRELAGYRMVLAKGGAKMPQVAASLAESGHKAGTSSQNFIYPGHIEGVAISSTGIGGLLSAVLRAPVADGTNLQGTYNVNLSYAPDDQPNAELPSLFTAVEEKLGVKLQPQKITVETVVIDHVSAAPTPN